MNIKASVIIPVYNAEKTIRRCVESLVLGRERDIEVILCEDCSTDNSWKLCCEIAEEYENVYCIQNMLNRGVSYTRNTALNRARGEYILFVDSDDWVSKKYILELLKTAGDNPDSLVLCGHHFIDKVNGTRCDYLWSEGESKTIVVKENGFFDLCDKFLLQQLWNKIFCRKLIEEHHIRFDETQSMGEDFQFVLDYLEATQIKKCVILNEPLYYYIRWNNNSLMSKFGFIDNQPEFDRIEKLARIVGSDEENYRNSMIAKIKQNYIYHITRNNNYSKKEKLDAIDRITGDGKASSYYRKQRLLFTKERIANIINMAKQCIPRFKARILRFRVKLRIAKAVHGVSAEGITFISQNCIGGVLYHDLGLKFLSPTINTFIPEPGFVKFVHNLYYYMEQELIMHWGEEYPIGMLKDVEIHFMHYETCADAKEAWNRRKNRVNWNRIFVIGTDRDGFNDVVYANWKDISYPKVLFTTHQEYLEDAVCFPEYGEEMQIGDLIPERKFYYRSVLIEKIKSFTRSE